MKKSGIALIAIAVLALILILWGIGAYNGLVTGREGLSEAENQIDVQLQRRSDLIPNLVNTVKGMTQHEQDIIDSVTEARKNLTAAGTIEEKAAADAQLTSSVGTLINVVMENYPDIKANQNFIALQDELAGTENRIAVARGDYNTKVKDYNAKVQRFPTSLIAGLGGFEKAAYYEVPEESMALPEVNFD